MRRLVLAVTAALACLPAAPAAAQTAVVQAVDDTTGAGNRWSPDAITVKAGEAVTWRFAGTSIPHNVTSNSANWSFQNAIAIAGPDASYAFMAPGYYDFVCQLHPGSMHGTVTVTDDAGNPPDPPDPPGPDEQPFPNDQGAPTVFELRDKVAPELTGVTVKPGKRLVRVHFALSERGTMTLVLTRGRSVRTERFKARRGVNDVVVRGLRAGRYQVELRAKDLAGNQAPPERARVTVRS
ncbi:cupredoxin domain-containing protein [Candidatus Solirubrobacter pratensis]|uniref:cupredoxin domain-containing protein n=1 Tax=Candidatus Solirubrobacter pratensis TaxID=1298857 RepID=UPI00041EB64A|nr:plastocyanin/azurin family copper-binding protein [Candidatus Solirubrobacter pratensis]